MNLLIEHQCPQCGAPATMEEAERLFACEFCRVKSYLMQQDYFRYCFSEKAPEGRELIYMPYWRFKGMSFFCTAEGVRHRFLDVSHQAVKSKYFPVSVGLRSQTLRLKFATSQTLGRFLKPTESPGKVMDIIEQRLGASLTKPVLHRAYIGETLSLIYAPFYVDTTICDAVLNKAVSAILPEDFNIADYPVTDSNWPIHFIPTLCPTCGWDLDGDRESLVLTCGNCKSVWKPDKSGLKQFTVAHFPDRSEDVIYLPFWRIKADVTRIDLNSYADLVRAANLPKVVQKNMDETPFHFWTLAFKLRPESFLRLSSQITICQPLEDPEEGMPQGGRLQPVTLSLKEAVESLKLNLASFLRPTKMLVEHLADIQITCKTFLLVYLPFYRGHHELVQPRFRIAISKNIFKLAKNL